jgi:hypothetical protein
MPTIGEVIQLARGGGADSLAAIKAVDAHRRTVARSLITSSEDEQRLAERAGEIADLAAAAFPWDPVAEDYEIAKLIDEHWGAPPRTNVLMAAMALGPAYHFPAPLRLALLPAWLRLHYARFLFGSPPIFLHPGEADRYASHSIEAMKVLRAAILDDGLPEARALAEAVSAASSVMIYFNEQQLKSYFRDKALIYEWLLASGEFSLGHAAPLLKTKKKKIGVLHRSLAPGTETYYLLAHLEGRERRDLEVTLYVFDPSSGAVADAFKPWVDHVVQLPNDIGAAVARIRQDRLDLCLVTNNVAWGLNKETAIAAHRLARVQVIGDASPTTPGLSSSDIFLSSEGNEPSRQAQDDYQETLVRMQGPTWYFGFSHDQDPQTITVTRAGLGIPDDHVLFFSGSNYFKITPEVLLAWAEILARTPGSSLALMPFNANWQTDYPVSMFVRRLNRVLATFGVAADRVKLFARVPTRADLQAVMSLADIYLDSFPYPGACSLVDPLLVGLPVVVRRGRKLRTAQASSLLEMEGLETAICAGTDAYVERATRLAEDPTFRAQEAGRVRRAAQPSLTCLRTTPLARKFTAFCTSAIAAADTNLDHLRGASEADLRAIVAHAAALALSDPTPALHRLTDSEIVSQLITPYLETLAGEGRAAGRVIEVGAAVGSHAMPRLAGEQPGDVDLIKIDAEGADLEILKGVDLAAITAKVLMAAFSAGFTNQSPVAVGAAIGEMDARGYGAVVFEYRAFAGPDGAGDRELVDVAFGSEGLGRAGNAFGTVMFYQRTDTTFLACLAQLIQTYGPAQSRPAVLAMQPATSKPRRGAEARNTARALNG